MNNRLLEELLKGMPGLKVGETMNGDPLKIQDVRGKRFLGTDKMASAVRRYWNRKPYDGDGSKEDVCAYIGEMKAEDDRIKAEHDAMVEVADDVADELKKAGDKRTRKQNKRRKNPDESDMVKMDYDRIKKLAASGGVTIEDLNRAVGQSGSWLNFREKNKDGMIPRAYAVTLAAALGVDPWEIAPEMAPVPEQIEMALDEIPDAPEEPEVPVTLHLADEFVDAFKAVKTGFFVELDAADMELIRVLSKAKNKSEIEVVEGIIKESLEGIRIMIAEL